MKTRDHTSPGSRTAAGWLALLLAGIGPLSGATVYVAPSSAWQLTTWRYHKGVGEPPAGWGDVAFDDTGWSSGRAPFGYPQHFAVQVATREHEWRDAAYAVETEEIPGGDTHRIHRFTFAEIQEIRHARIVLSGTNPAVKEYGDRYTLTEFMVIAAPPLQP